MQQSGGPYQPAFDRGCIVAAGLASRAVRHDRGQLGSRLTLKKGSRFVRGMMLCVLFLLLAKMITDMLQ